MNLKSDLVAAAIPSAQKRGFSVGFPLLDSSQECRRRNSQSIRREPSMHVFFIGERDRRAVRKGERRGERDGTTRIPFNWKTHCTAGSDNKSYRSPCTVARNLLHAQCNPIKTSVYKLENFGLRLFRGGKTQRGFC